MLELHSSSEASFSRLHQITTTSAQLGEEIRAVVGLSAGKLFAEAIERARSTLEEIGGQAALVGAPNDDTARARLEDFAAHYTMQAERDVHESVAAGATVGESVTAEVSVIAVESDDLGANVELF